MDKIYKTVEQICESCGKHFYLKYCSDGTYEYVGEVCDCEADFHPVEGETSISEWLETLSSVEIGISIKVHEKQTKEGDYMNCSISNNINKIKSALGQYEKLLFDTEIIRNTCVSQSVKNMIYKELQLECDEWKRKLIDFISELPDVVNTDISNNTTSTEETAQKMNSEQEVSIIEKTSEQKWKEGFSEKIHAIYDRNLKYIETKEVFKEIYEYMTNSYGIVWEQDFKEWRRTNDGVPRTLDIIFNNAQYKSIFDAVLQDKYSEAIESNPVSIKEIVEPLANKNQDKSKGYCSTLKKIYTYMSETYNIDWDKHKRKYFKEKGYLPKTKSDLLYFNHGLIERFRVSVNYFMEK